MRSEFDLDHEDVECGGLPLRRYVLSASGGTSRGTIVCVPGFSASGRSFARLAPLAREFDLHLVAPPLEVSYPGDPVRSESEVIAEYLTQFDRPVLVGTSFGGLVSIRAAARAKGALGGLVLVGAFARGTGLIPRMLPFMRSILPLLQVAAAPLAPVTARVVGGRHIDGAGARAIVEDTRAIPATERARRLRTIFRTDLTPLLPEIAAPSIVIHGTSDHLVPVHLAREMAACLPDTTYHEIETCGHLPYVTHPGTVLEILGGFLARVRPRQPTMRGEAVPDRELTT